MDLRTRNMAGFQLLDIQDYPGQGSAYVGILDAFMDSKEIVDAKRWRQWCDKVVPMAELPRLTYSEGDTITWKTIVANYDADDSALEGKTMKWAFLSDKNVVLAQDSTKLSNVKVGVIDVSCDSVVARLSKTKKAEKVKLALSIIDTPYHNDYTLWIYPNYDMEKQMGTLSKGIVIADTLDETVMKKLKTGAKVLLMPKKGMYADQTVGGLVQTDYWNYRMFKTISENNKKPVSPGTLGLLVNEMEHPLFKSFPTDKHTNWQWASIVHESRPLVMDKMPQGYRPLVQVIDNVERNHRLALFFETNVGKGKVFVCMSDLRETQQYPESRHLLRSILEYMQSEDFKPATTLLPDDFGRFFTEKAQESNVSELRNISYD